MQLSTRNQFPGRVVSVASGEAMSAVTVRLDSGQEVTSAITTDSARELKLAEGTPVRAMVKSTEVAVATGAVEGLSIRNRLPGVVTSVSSGAAMSTVRIETPGGETITAAITRDAAEELKLEPGAEVTALVKATEVSLAVG
ncbi:TOBE domain-containing protein [Actinoplanes sp. LDG1-01]|uniref:TOBE domain-containing protein n=2 Tax=Paractinoplanes lichenicola TaxID=2802976 RepID=A0ABS1VZM9_9ACTN|nr:TOBE domain-containing protein [Actinoplanes lichenicola]